MGEPSMYRYAFSKGGDMRTAWSPLKQNDGIQWLELHYPRTVKARSVGVNETHNPGALIRVTTFDANGKESTAWEGDDPVEIRDGWGVATVRFTEPVDTKRIRLYLDTDKVDGWNQIDAVALWDVDKKYYWAIDADASSTYAFEPKPKSFYFTYEGPLTEIKYDKGFNKEIQCLRDKRHVIEMKRAEATPYLKEIRILSTRSGSSLRAEDSKLMILDSDMKVLYESKVGRSIYQSGLRWYLFEVPSVKVPETFRIAFQTNSDEHGMIYVGTRVCNEGETGHSFEQSIDTGELSPLKQGNAAADWVIRTYLSETP
jgi:hypothetical protein